MPLSGRYHTQDVLNVAHFLLKTGGAMATKTYNTSVQRGGCHFSLGSDPAPPTDGHL